MGIKIQFYRNFTIQNTFMSKISPNGGRVKRVQCIAEFQILQVLIAVFCVFLRKMITKLRMLYFIETKTHTSYIIQYTRKDL